MVCLPDEFTAKDIDSCLVDQVESNSILKSTSFGWCDKKTQSNLTSAHRMLQAVKEHDPPPRAADMTDFLTVVFASLGYFVRYPVDTSTSALSAGDAAEVKEEGKPDLTGAEALSAMWADFLENADKQIADFSIYGCFKHLLAEEVQASVDSHAQRLYQGGAAKRSSALHADPPREAKKRKKAMATEAELDEQTAALLGM
eukprot:6468340-Amphidinium_carterae.1